MKNTFIFLLALLLSTTGLYARFPGKDNAAAVLLCDPVRFVKQGASGSGASWADASGDLQAMIDLQAGCGGGEVWVASGTYIPVRRADATGTLTPNDRNNAFVLRNNVKVFGGFAGTEAVFGERVLNPGAPSVLSGDFNGDDVISGAGETLTITGNGENALHVVISAGNVGSAVLNGFTVTGGFADGANANLITINSVGIIGSRGGGMFIRSSSPGIANCLFEGNATSPDNSTFASGAGIYCEGPVVISASIFSRNRAYLGGGMLVLNGSASLNNCAFSDNRASEGGGLNNNAGSNSTVTACTFTGNYADVAGGGLLTSTIVNVKGSTFANNTAVSSGGGGAIRIFASGNATIDACTFSGNRVTGSSGRGGAINNSVSLTVTGSTFSDNEAFSGGGISHNGTLANISGSSFNNNKATEGGGIKTFSSSLTLQDVILNNNSATDGGGLFNSDASPQVSNVTFSGNSATNSGGGMLNFTPSPEARIRARIASPAVKRSVTRNANSYEVPAVTSVGEFTDEFTEAPSNRGLRVAAASPTVINSTFTNNTSGGSGGGICNIRSSPVVINTLITGNTAGSLGGGIRNQGDSNGSFINTTIANNMADTGGGVANLGSNPVITNSIIFGNSSGIANEASTPAVTFSLVQGGATGEGNINADPLFVNAGGGDFHLQGPSPAINAGSNAAVPAGVTTDLGGVTRIQQGTVDMGAFENTGVQQPLTVTINQAPTQADPTSTLPIRFVVVFSEPVTGFSSPSDISLAGSTAVGALGISITGSGTTYEVIVSGLMYSSGTVVASVPANAAQNSSGSGNQASTSTDNTVQYNDPKIKVQVAAGQTNPTSLSPINFTVTFSEVPLVPFTSAQVSVGGTAGATTAVVTGSDTTYNVAVSGMTQAGTVNITISQNTGGLGLPAVTGPSVQFQVSTGLPTVTINQASGQADPASASPINFTVVFSQVVTGFTPAGVSLAGTTAGGTLAVAVTGSGTTYNVAVSGMTSEGLVEAGILAGAAQNGSGALNTASTSIDSTVMFINPCPVLIPGSVIIPDGPTELCEDDKVTLTAAQGASYLWSNGATTRAITVSAAGTYKVTVTSAQGCKSEESITVTKKVCNLPPVAVCKPLVVLVANPDCYAVLTPKDLDAGSYDPNGDWTRHTLLNTDGIFRPGNYMVTYEVMDPKGAFSTCESRVQVVDHTPPVARVRGLRLELDAAGRASISVADVSDGSYDNCGPVTMSLNRTTFDCSDLGHLQVRLTVTDASGNVSEALADITIMDNTPPVIQATDLTLTLDENGRASFSNESLITGISDNCGIWSVSVSQNEFTCDHIGKNEVVITVEDVQGNRTTATVTVRVEDRTPPVVKAKNVTLYLDKTGKASLTPAQVDDGSKDNCGITRLGIDREEFDCKDLGEQTLTLTAEDAAGNTSEASFTVTVLDTLAPVVLARDITLYLDGAGKASLASVDIDEGSSDNCGIASRSLQSTTFDCGNVGTQAVQYTVTDGSGNRTVVVIRVTVRDTTAPEVLARNAVVELDWNGKATLSAGDVDDGSSDNCGIAELSLSQTDFTCADLGSRRVTLTVKDVNGNQSSERASVLIKDPKGVCPCSYGVLAYKGVTLRNNEVSAGGVGVIRKGKKIRLRNTVIDREGTFVKAPQSRFDNESEASIYIRGSAPEPEAFRSNSNKDKKKEKVGNGDSRSFTSGRYGKIKAGKDASLTFSGGEVFIRSLKVKKNASLVFTGPTTLLVRNTVKLGRNTTLNTGGEMIRVYAGGGISVGNASEVRGILHSKSKLKAHGGSEITSLEGLFVANKIRAGKNTHWAGGGVLCTGNDEPESRVAAKKERRKAESAPTPASLTDSTGIRVNLWPNPVVTGLLKVLIESETTGGDLFIVDMQGNIVYRKAYTGQYSRQEIDLGKLQTGAYIVRVSSGGKEKTLRLFKEKRN